MFNGGLIPLETRWCVISYSHDTNEHKDVINLQLRFVSIIQSEFPNHGTYSNMDVFQDSIKFIRLASRRPELASHLRALTDIVIFGVRYQQMKVVIRREYLGRCAYNISL